MNSSKRPQLWNQRYSTSTQALPAAAKVLIENAHLLPQHGQALDLACGLGANALLLAQLGLTTTAWDYAHNAINQLQQTAQSASVQITTDVRDVIAHPPTPESFNVIVVSRFLERSLAPALMAALKPQGLLFYQTFTVCKAQQGGPSNADFLLADNELLQLFSALKLRAYREENALGDISQGLRNMAYLVGEKPKL